MIRPLNCAVVLAVMAGLTLAQACYATPEPLRASVPVTVQQSMSDAQLIGDGTLTWFGFRVYDARLFAGQNFSIKEGWAKQPFALELMYSRNVSGKQITESSRDEMIRLKLGNEAKRALWTTNMEALFIDVKKGDRIIGVYKPGQATKFWLNDKPLGTVQDAEFGPAFFGIWLDEETKDKGLRTALLGAGSPKKTAPP